MKWEGNRESDNVEDARGGGGFRVGGRGGYDEGEGEDKAHRGLRGDLLDSRAEPNAIGALESSY